MDSDYGIPTELSNLQKQSALYQPELPPYLQGAAVRVEYGDATSASDPAGAHTISRSFPHTFGQPLVHFLRATAKVPGAQIITEQPAMRIGIVFCGRQSPEGHNVVLGLHAALKIHNPKSVLLGFLGGSEGLFAQKTLEITDDVLATYKNQGGYDLLGRTKDQIRTIEQVNGALKACTDLKLDALVIIGGVTSNTDAAQLAETFAEAKCPTKVVGVPVTLNGDLKNQFVESNVGFDTICKVNSQLISLNFDRGSISICPNKNVANGFKNKHGSMNGLSDPITDPSPPSSTTSEVESPEDIDSSTSNMILKFISEMLMEEDLEQKTCMLQDCLALQATEKSFYDVLDQKYSPDLEDCSFSHIQSTLTRSTENPDNVFSPQCSSSSGSINDDCCCVSNSSVVPNSVRNPRSDSSFVSDAWIEISDMEDNSRSGPLAAVSSGKKNHVREEDDDGGGERSNKQTAFTREEAEEDDEDEKLFDAVLLCPGLIHNVECPLFDDNFKIEDNAKPLFGRGRTIDAKKKKKKKNGRKGEVIDLWTLLTQCAQAVASNDHRSSTELLKQIRQHSSAFGDGNQRLAHYFANGLESRLDGTETRSYLGQAGFMSSAADILKAYQMWVQAAPFKRMSNVLANRTIMKMAEKSEKTNRLHIIDFGILYGFQWPCLIQRIAKRHGGPPKLRITGIELPQPGFRPAERVEETGRRLLKYCKRFGVEAEYHSIAKKWETIKLDDLKIDPDEMTVVNCLYRLRNLPDESVVMDSPRDTVLNLIRRINPDLFVFGSVNGTYNAPFFLTRFREALFHFSTLFDIFDATVERENEHRMLFEREVYGRDAMNVIACEGLARVERPETYKQWQVRNVRAGFRQIALDQDIYKRVKHTVRAEYHKDFIIDLDGQWMLQGWKGRVIHALSCWVPA